MIRKIKRMYRENPVQFVVVAIGGILLSIKDPQFPIFCAILYTLVRSITDKGR